MSEFFNADKTASPRRFDAQAESHVAEVDGDVVSLYDTDPNTNFGDELTVIGYEPDEPEEQAPIEAMQVADDDFVSAVRQRIETDIHETSEMREVRLGTGYQRIVAIIEQGIGTSRQTGYETLKVKIPGGKSIPLGEFIASDVFKAQRAGELTKEGVQLILETYLPLIQSKDVQVAEQNVPYTDVKILSSEPKPNARYADQD